MDAIFPKHILGTAKEYDFEGRRYTGVEHADEYLTINFGSDYMQLPPEGKRLQHHFFFLDLNRPHRELSAREIQEATVVTS